MASSNKEPCFQKIEFSSQTDKKKHAYDLYLLYSIVLKKKNNLLSLNNFDSTEDHSKHWK